MNRTPTVLGALAATLVLGACDIPTSAPIVEQRWIVPVETISLSVDELLPSSVVLSGNTFDVSLDPFTASTTLGAVCAACAAVNGLTVPVPAFSGTFDVTESLPADVDAAMIASGNIQLAIQNTFSFDPVEGGGSITVTLTDGPGGAQLGQVTVDGTTESLSSGATILKNLVLSSGSVSELYASVAIQSVGGQTATVGINNQVRVTATTTSLEVSSATVDVQGQTVSFDEESLDFDFDEDVTSRIREGTVLLDIVNPFGISVTGNINLGSVPAKSFTIPGSATSQVSITYTGDELAQILSDDNATFSGSGAVTGASITVMPGQEIIAEATIDLTIEIG